MTVTLAPAAAAIPRTPRRLAAKVAATETAMFLAVLDALPAEGWDASTDCDRWRVREIVAHVAGAAEDSVRLRTMVRHVREANRRYPELTRLDGLNEAQVDDRRHLAPDELRAAVGALLPRATRARARPLPVRGIPLPMGEPLGKAPLAYLNDVIYVRDTWMHRIDITHATGTPFERGEHEAEIVRQVLRDLGRAWEGPCVQVELTGPAAGTWKLGERTATGTVRVPDDVAWCRALSGCGDLPAVDVVEGDPPLAAFARPVAF